MRIMVNIIIVEFSLKLNKNRLNLIRAKIRKSFVGLGYNKEYQLKVKFKLILDRPM